LCARRIWARRGLQNKLGYQIKLLLLLPLLLQRIPIYYHYYYYYILRTCLEHRTPRVRGLELKVELVNGEQQLWLADYESVQIVGRAVIDRKQMQTWAAKDG
jgi:hypothetical protein